MNKVLFADNAGRQFQKVYGQSHIALAGLVPVGLLTDGHSFPGKAADFGLAFALPVHSHIGLNFVVADYVPKMLQVPARVGVLGMSTIMFLGLMRLNIMGPGLCSSIKQLWQKEVQQ